MRADRRINAARPVQARTADNFIVQSLAHAVQALKLIIVDAKLLRPGMNRSHAVRIVRGKLRIKGGSRNQQQTNTKQERQNKKHKTQKDRKNTQAVDLRTLDFAIPVSALD